MHLLEATLQLNLAKLSGCLMIKWHNKCIETIAKLNLPSN